MRARVGQSGARWESDASDRRRRAVWPRSGGRPVLPRAAMSAIATRSPAKERNAITVSSASHPAPDNQHPHRRFGHGSRSAVLVRGHRLIFSDHDPRRKRPAARRRSHRGQCVWGMVHLFLRAAYVGRGLRVWPGRRPVNRCRRDLGGAPSSGSVSSRRGRVPGHRNDRADDLAASPSRCPCRAHVSPGTGALPPRTRSGADDPSVYPTFRFQIASLPMGDHPYTPAASGRIEVVVGGNPRGDGGRADRGLWRRDYARSGQVRVGREDSSGVRLVVRSCPPEGVAVVVHSLRLPGTSVNFGAPAIVVEGLQKTFGPTIALQGVDLVVEPGTIQALLGPNGAGKTTLVRVLSTLAAPDAGRALICGVDVVREPQRARSLIGLAGQSAAGGWDLDRAREPRARWPALRSGTCRGGRTGGRGAGAVVVDHGG